MFNKKEFLQQELKQVEVRLAYILDKGIDKRNSKQFSNLARKHRLLERASRVNCVL